MSTNGVYDIAIVGCGPAGLSAAVNAVIREQKIILSGAQFWISKMKLVAPGGQLFWGAPGETG